MKKILKKIKIAIKEKNLLHKIYKKIYPYFKGFFLCLVFKKDKGPLILVGLLFKKVFLPNEFTSKNTGIY